MQRITRSLNWRQNQEGTWTARAGSLRCLVSLDGSRAYIVQRATRRVVATVTITDHITGFAWCKEQVQQRRAPAPAT